MFLVCLVVSERKRCKKLLNEVIKNELRITNKKWKKASSQIGRTFLQQALPYIVRVIEMFAKFLYRSCHFNCVTKFAIQTGWNLSRGICESITERPKFTIFVQSSLILYIANLTQRFLIVSKLTR